MTRQVEKLSEIYTGVAMSLTPAGREYRPSGRAREAPKWIEAARRPVAEHRRDAIVDRDHDVEEDHRLLILVTP